MIEDYMDKVNTITICKTLEDIFKNPVLDSVEDYKIIIENLLNTELKEKFILKFINYGRTDIVIENIDALRIEDNWHLAKKNSQFYKIFFENFQKILDNTGEVNDTGVLSELAKASYIIDEQSDKKKIDGIELIISNWRGLSEKTSLSTRIELLNILKSTEKGRKIIVDELPNLFYGNHTYSYFIRDILKDNVISREQIADLIIKEPIRMLSETFEKEDYLFNVKDFISLLEQIDELLETTPFLEQSQKQHTRESIEKYLSQNFEKLIEKLEEKEEFKSGEGFEINELKLINKFDTENHLIRKKLEENYEKISNNIKKEDIIDLIHLYSNMDIQTEEIDIETVIKQSFSNIKDENLQWAISRMVSELLKDQKLLIRDMEIFGRGNYNRSIKIGEYILKIGTDRVTNEIPYDERIIQPLIRRKMEGKQGEEVYVEVQNLVDRNWYKGLSDEEIDEELYKIYIEMKNRGNRWTDVSKYNVGRLLKPNLQNFEIDGKQITPMDSAIGIKTDDNDVSERKVLPEGELVVIDTDYVYKNYKPYKTSIASRHKIFEERYMKECAILDTRIRIAGPKILTSAVEISKEEITDKDIIQMSRSVADKQKSKETQNNNSYDENHTIRKIILEIIKK